MSVRIVSIWKTLADEARSRWFLSPSSRSVKTQSLCWIIHEFGRRAGNRLQIIYDVKDRDEHEITAARGNGMEHTGCNCTLDPTGKLEWESTFFNRFTFEPWPQHIKLIGYISVTSEDILCMCLGCCRIGLWMLIWSGWRIRINNILFISSSCFVFLYYIYIRTCLGYTFIPMFTDV